MKKLTKKEIWDAIKKRGFAINNSHDFIYLIENNLDRIEFAKDHIGLRDVLFVAEEGVDFFDFDIFISLNNDIMPQKDSQRMMEAEFRNNIETYERVVLSQLKAHFNETDRKLGFCFGFRESSKVDSKEVAQYLLNNLLENQTMSQVMRKLREFPDWYEESALDPEEFDIIPKKVELYLKKKLSNKKLKNLKITVDSSILKEKENKITFKKLKNFSKELDRLIDENPGKQ